MEIEFIEQKTECCVSTHDKVAVYGCEMPEVNGSWQVVYGDDESGELLLVGLGDRAGFVSVVGLDDEYVELHRLH